MSKQTTTKPSTGFTNKLSQPEELKKLKDEMPHEFQFRRDMAEAAYRSVVESGKSEATIQYMRELVEFYDNI